MKIQIDQNGVVQQTNRTKTVASGLLIMRHRQKLMIEIGTRVTANALLGTIGHIRSLQTDTFITSKKPAFAGFLTSQKLSITQACLVLGQITLAVIERKYEHLRTTKLDYLTQRDAQKLPAKLHSLADLRLMGLDTSTALTRLEERDMEEIAFIIPTNDKHFKIHKLPLSHDWPSHCPYLPLPVEEILPSSFHLWFTALYQIALSVKRPLIHHCDMMIPLSQRRDFEAELASPNILQQNEISPSLASPQWYSLIRILYPLAADTEKPSNFRLLTIAITRKDDHILL